MRGGGFKSTLLLLLFPPVTLLALCWVVENKDRDEDADGDDEDAGGDADRALRLNGAVSPAGSWEATAAAAAAEDLEAAATAAAAAMGEMGGGCATEAVGTKGGVPLGKLLKMEAAVGKCAATLARDRGETAAAATADDERPERSEDVFGCCCCCCCGCDCDDC